MADPQSFKTMYGDKSYFLSMVLCNSEGDATVLNRSNLKFLELVDNILNPFHTGIAIITNDFNIIESGTLPYTFLGNGRDYLAITITTENTDEDFNLSFIMTVTECVDVEYQNSLCKQLTFCEHRQFQLNEKYCDILEIKKNEKGAASYLETNAGSAQKTGDLIKKILQATFKDADDIFGDTYDEQGCLDINLSPYGVMPYSQLLSYVLMSHSHEKSPCFLSHDRQTKKFSLISFKKLFAEHENKVVERLIYPDAQQQLYKSKRSEPNIKFIPTDKVFGSNGQGADSIIIEYFSESPTALHGVNYFANQAITGFSRNFSTFSYNLKMLSKNEYTKMYYDLFVEPFRKMFNDPKVYQLVPNFYVSKVDQEKNWTQIDGALPQAITEQQFMNQKLFSLLFLNQTYTFKLPGITRRRSGTFVDLYKETATKENPVSNWDYNTLGRHLVSCVKHTFTHDTYVNHVETIKPYRIYNKRENALDLNAMLSYYNQ